MISPLMDSQLDVRAIGRILEKMANISLQSLTSPKMAAGDVPIDESHAAPANKPSNLEDLVEANANNSDSSTEGAPSITPQASSNVLPPSYSQEEDTISAQSLLNLIFGLKTPTLADVLNVSSQIFRN